MTKLIEIRNSKDKYTIAMKAKGYEILTRQRHLSDLTFEFDLKFEFDSKYKYTVVIGV